MYSIAGFDVARCNPKFRLSDSSLLVQFSDAISLNEFTEPISPIPEECSRFRSQGELFGLANTNTQLPETSLGRSPRWSHVCLLSSRNLALARLLAQIIRLRAHFPDFLLKTIRLDNASEFIEYLKKEFEMKDLGKTKVCLGLQLEELFTPNIFILYINHKLRLSNIKFYKKFNSKHCFN
ncbi:unnamed protein product [Brassica oleracea]